MFKKFLSLLMVAVLSLSLVACGSSGAAKQVIIYSNADEEALNAIKKTLDENGYEGKYIAQAFGTNELGGKLIAEGKNIEADLITMSSFYIESAQADKNMFAKLNVSAHPLREYPDYYLPALGIEGTILINTKVLEENNLPLPTSVKDLANPVYDGFMSVVDVKGSSTAWLMIQSLINTYGEDETKEILSAIYKNAADHLETSGSGPLKKIRAGEVAIGFGLRHQAVADKLAGKPIDYVDPSEGNFSLTESYALIDKGDKTNPLATEMLQCLIDNAREEIIKDYPIVLYEGETVDKEFISSNPQLYKEALTLKLLQEHQALSESCKP